MSRLFEAYYHSFPEGGWEAAEEARINDLHREHELHEAEADLLNGIQDQQPFEFVFFASPDYTKPLHK